MHPFHPLAGSEFEFVKRWRNWQEDRIYFYDRQGELSSLPAEWTKWLPTRSSSWPRAECRSISLGCSSWRS